LLLQHCLKLQVLFFLKQVAFYKPHLALFHLQQPRYLLLVLSKLVKRLFRPLLLPLLLHLLPLALLLPLVLSKLVNQVFKPHLVLLLLT
jgi:hypothetical protein